MKWIKQIIKVEPYTVTCLWNDNEIRKIDLTEFILRHVENKNNSYYQLINKKRFSDVKCDGTSLYWENGIVILDYDGTEKSGPLDIDPDFLYNLSEAVESKMSKEKST